MSLTKEGTIYANCRHWEVHLLLIQDWAKLPPGETFAMVSAVATDSQDQVYGFRKDPPIVIFDRNGISSAPGATERSTLPMGSLSPTTPCTSRTGTTQCA